MKENSKELRIKAAEKAKKKQVTSLADEIKQRMDIAWGNWQPDYEGWLNWSNELYSPNATVSAIGDEVQQLRDYQVSMKDQRDVCDMEMGPIIQMVVEENVVALIYHMYLTPKNKVNAPTFDMLVTEFNQLEKIDGKLMVTHFDLYTDGGGM